MVIATLAWRWPAIVALVCLAAIIPFVARAQEPVTWEVYALSQIVPGSRIGRIDFYPDTRTAVGTNGVCVKYGNAVLTADTVSANEETGEAVADGQVHIQSGDQVWVGDHIRYNFKTHQMQSEQFRTGKPPVFAAGKNLSGDISNQTYTARHAFVTTDDVSDPATRIRASRIKIVPGKYIEMWNAVLFMGDVPVFYFPYYTRNLGPHANNWNFLGGFSSANGAYLLSTYNWWYNDAMDGKFHLDYREKRGPGVGPDINLHLGQWGDGTFKYYYTHDRDQYEGTNGLPDFGPISENRQRVYFGWQATPVTNLNIKALVNYQSDPFLLHDFFESEYRDNPQPNTFIEANKYWDNWSVDALTTPQVNDFFNQVERLPDVRLTGFRQQVLDTPVYYNSESSAGYYQTFFAETNGVTPPPAYAAARADTYHQLLLPWTFFNWLNVTPRVGGRVTYYSDESGPGGTNSEAYRTVFNTGVGTSFKASHLWMGATNSFLAVNGLRHIIEPSANYVFVPNPSKEPSQLPQFDSALPSLQLLPVEFPDYNNIDSIDSQNVIRLGLRNTLQTKRGGQLDNLLNWNLTLDWRLNPHGDTVNLDEPFSQPQSFSDLYSDLRFKPQTWVTFDSRLRYDINYNQLNLAFHQLTLAPNDRWSWGIGHWYLRGGFDGFTQRNDYLTSTIFYRVNDNYGLRATQNFNLDAGRLQQQFYSIYRDMRNWTGALTLRVTDNSSGPTDFTVAFTFSLKAAPSRSMGSDAVNPDSLIGN